MTAGAATRRHRPWGRRGSGRSAPRTSFRPPRGTAEPAPELPELPEPPEAPEVRPAAPLPSRGPMTRTSLRRRPTPPAPIPPAAAVRILSQTDARADCRLLPEQGAPPPGSRPPPPRLRLPASPRDAPGAPVTPCGVGVHRPPGPAPPATGAPHRTRRSPARPAPARPRRQAWPRVHRAPPGRWIAGVGTAASAAVRGKHGAPEQPPESAAPPVAGQPAAPTRGPGHAARRGWRGIAPSPRSCGRTPGAPPRGPLEPVAHAGPGRAAAAGPAPWSPRRRASGPPGSACVRADRSGGRVPPPSAVGGGACAGGCGAAFGGRPATGPRFAGAAPGRVPAARLARAGRIHTDGPGAARRGATDPGPRPVCRAGHPRTDPAGVRGSRRRPARRSARCGGVPVGTGPPPASALPHGDGQEPGRWPQGPCMRPRPTGGRPGVPAPSPQRAQP